MKRFTYNLDVDSFLDSYSYSSKNLRLPDLCVFGTVNTEKSNDLFWLWEKRGTVRRQPM